MTIRLFLHRIFSGYLHKQSWRRLCFFPLHHLYYTLSIFVKLPIPLIIPLDIPLNDPRGMTITCLTFLLVFSKCFCNGFSSRKQQIVPLQLWNIVTWRKTYWPNFSCDVQRGHTKRNHNNAFVHNFFVLKVWLLDSFKHLPDSCFTQITA